MFTVTNYYSLIRHSYFRFVSFFKASNENINLTKNPAIWNCRRHFSLLLIIIIIFNIISFIVNHNYYEQTVNVVVYACVVVYMYACTCIYMHTCMRTHAYNTTVCS